MWDGTAGGVGSGSSVAGEAGGRHGRQRHVPQPLLGLVHLPAGCRLAPLAPPPAHLPPPSYLPPACLPAAEVEGIREYLVEECKVPADKLKGFRGEWRGQPPPLSAVLLPWSGSRCLPQLPSHRRLLAPPSEESITQSGTRSPHQPSPHHNAPCTHTLLTPLLPAPSPHTPHTTTCSPLPGAQRAVPQRTAGGWLPVRLLHHGALQHGDLPLLGPAHLPVHHGRRRPAGGAGLGWAGGACLQARTLVEHRAGGLGAPGAAGPRWQPGPKGVGYPGAPPLQPPSLLPCPRACPHRHTHMHTRTNHTSLPGPPQDCGWPGNTEMSCSADERHAGLWEVPVWMLPSAEGENGFTMDPEAASSVSRGTCSTDST